MNNLLFGIGRRSGRRPSNKFAGYVQKTYDSMSRYGIEVEKYDDVTRRLHVSVPEFSDVMENGAEMSGWRLIDALKARMTEKGYRGDFIVGRIRFGERHLASDKGSANADPLFGELLPRAS